MEKKTAFYKKHVEAGGKMVPYAGYELPVQYGTGIIKEHTAVRERAGLFDVSHMGEFLLTGADALHNLNKLLTNDFTDMKAGQVRYSPMCYENGGTVDDLLVYKSGEEKYYIVVNAANRHKDFEWMQPKITGQAELADISDGVAQVALQGPLAPDILAAVAPAGSIPAQYYTFLENCSVGGVCCLVSKTGYTGETGYEIYCKNEDAEKLWDVMMEAGAEFGMIPCGLGARDTLRLEAGMPLYGHELSGDISPREANLSIFVKLDKPDFIGRDALAKDRERKRIGFILKEKGIAREGSAVFDGDRQIGVVTSGTMSPTLNAAIASAIVPVDFTGKEVHVEIRNKRVLAEVVKMPFVTKK
ncbi:MAG TPA: glycine cleavage system aminomethyltransferase GcvT [Clostridiales bacterium]|nr:glycine cleavage system aminomethyltransferase GcvT [Clostridiales bacterium]